MKNPCNKTCIVLAVCTKVCNKKSDYLIYLSNELKKYEHKDPKRKELLELKRVNRLEIMQIFSRKNGFKHERSL